MFLTYVIKVDKREILRLYFKYIFVLLSFFLENYPYTVKVNNLAHITSLLPVGSGQFDTFFGMSSKLIKEKYLD